MQRAFTAALSVQTRMALEKLIEVEAGATVCQLAWLRTASLSPAIDQYRLTGPRSAGHATVCIYRDETARHA